MPCVLIKHPIWIYEIIQNKKRMKKQKEKTMSSIWHGLPLAVFELSGSDDMINSLSSTKISI